MMKVRVMKIVEVFLIFAMTTNTPVLASTARYSFLYSSTTRVYQILSLRCAFSAEAIQSIPLMRRGPDPMIADPYNPQTLNKYSYVGNNPVNYTDLTGESWFSSVVGAVGSAISSAWNSVVSGIAGAAQRLGNWLQQNVWTPLASAIASIPSMISNLIDQVSDAIISAGLRLVAWSKVALFDTGQFFSKAWEDVKAVAGFVWASVGVMGIDMILTGLAYLTGSEVEYIDGAIVIRGGLIGNGLTTSKNGEGTGITLGNAIFLHDDADAATLYHEFQHIKQYRSWGLAFVPVYAGRYLIEVTKYYFTKHVWWDHFGYCNEWFENQAYKAEAKAYPQESGSLGCTY